MANLIIVIILLIIVGAAILYIKKEKKKGIRCIGCPYAGTCTKYNGCGSKKTK